MSLTQNIKKTLNYSRKNGYEEALYAAWERLTVRYCAGYTYQAPDSSILEEQRKDKSVSDIKFSILVPAYETLPEYMKALVDSCVNQTYEKWELIIADGSTSNVVKDVVDQYQDTRIRYVRLERNEGIAGNTNKAIALAEGDYYGLLDHDDMLTEDALYEMAHAISGKNPVFAYSDEDKCDSSGKKFYDPHFKLDFNLDLLFTNNYVCHFMVVQAEQIKKLGIRGEYDGSQDYDLILRIVSSLFLKEKENNEAKHVEEAIVHVPKVLYHWRCHENSTAENPQSKMYAYETGKKALIDFAARMGWKAEVRHNKHLGFYRIHYRNCVLNHRPDLAAVGGFVVKGGRIVSEMYKGQPILYAGYMNRMDLFQNTQMLDIRNMAVNKPYQKLYEAVTGHPYESTFYMDQKELPQWIKDMEKTAEGRQQLAELGKKLCSRLVEDGSRLLLDPICVRKM